MSFGLLFLIILAIWIGPKLIRGAMFVHRVRKQTRSMFEQMHGTQDAEPRARKAGWSSPTPRRKKIDPSVGEYVKFQEVADDADAPSRHSFDADDTSTYTVEQQVTDAEWEDIKE